MLKGLEALVQGLEALLKGREALLKGSLEKQVKGGHHLQWWWWSICRSPAKVRQPHFHLLLAMLTGSLYNAADVKWAHFIRG